MRTEIDRDAPLTACERALGGLGIISFGLSLFAVALLCGGCTSEYTGSSTIVGEQLALPEITDSSDSVAVRVYESIKGARVWTAKDSRVTITYANSYTNSYLGIVETQDTMTLSVEVEPLAVATDAAESAAPTP